MKRTEASAKETLRVTVLGSSSSIPRPGRACSSYLIEAPGSSLVADLGSGGLANLRRYLPSERLDAVVISHMHADHFIDVIPMRYELKYGPRSNDRKVKLFLPPGGEAMLRKLVDAFTRESPHDFIGEVFEPITYDPSVPLQVGETTLRFAPTVHFIPTFALRAESGGSSVAYSSDTGPSSAVAALAYGVDLFLCESTLLPGECEVAERGHISAAEAGTLAREADVRRLVLTHYPMETNAAELFGEATRNFSGAITVADDLDRLDLN